MTHRPKSNKRKNPELSIRSTHRIFNRRLKLLPRDYWREQFACNLQNRPLNRATKIRKRKKVRMAPSVSRFVSSFLSLIQTRLSRFARFSSRYSIGPRGPHTRDKFSRAVSPFWKRCNRVPRNPTHACVHVRNPSSAANNPCVRVILARYHKGSSDNDEWKATHYRSYNTHSYSCSNPSNRVCVLRAHTSLHSFLARFLSHVGTIENRARVEENDSNRETNASAPPDLCQLCSLRVRRFVAEEIHSQSYSPLFNVAKFAKFSVGWISKDSSVVARSTPWLLVLFSFFFNGNDSKDFQR